MKLAVAAVMACSIMVSCGGNRENVTKRAQAPTRQSLDDAKIECVADGGFLVPSGNDFACKLSSGRVVGLMEL